MSQLKFLVKLFFPYCLLNKYEESKCGFDTLLFNRFLNN